MSNRRKKINAKRAALKKFGAKEKIPKPDVAALRSQSSARAIEVDAITKTHTRKRTRKKELQKIILLASDPVVQLLDEFGSKKGPYLIFISPRPNTGH
jgi:hypothetical protein